MPDRRQGFLPDMVYTTSSPPYVRGFTRYSFVYQRHEGVFIACHALVSFKDAVLDMIDEKFDFDAKADEGERNHQGVVALLFDTEHDLLAAQKTEKSEHSFKVSHRRPLHFRNRSWLSSLRQLRAEEFPDCAAAITSAIVRPRNW